MIPAPPGRVLVTGATGFIGRHVASHLIGSGHSVTLAVRNISKVPKKWLDDPRIRIVLVEDIASSDLVPALAQVRAVVHAAGIARVDRLSPNEALSANLTSVERLVEGARSAGIGQFVFLSSVLAVSGNTSQLKIDDDSAAHPSTRYGELKAAAEEVVARLGADQFAISLRPPIVIGGDAGGNWRRLQQLAASGMPLPFASLRAKRSYLPVDDLARAIVTLTTKDWPVPASGNYCIAPPETLTLGEVITELRSGMNLPNRLFGVPPGLFHAVGQLTGHGHEVASMTGALEVDGSRFASTFSFTPAAPLRERIRSSGRAFLAASGRAQ